MQIWPDGRSGEKSCNNGIGSARDWRTLSGQVCRHHTEVLPQLRDIPSFTPEQSQPHLRRVDRVALAGDRLDQGRFAAAVRPQNGHMLAPLDTQADVMQHHGIPPCDIYVGHLKKLRRLAQKFRLLLARIRAAMTSTISLPRGFRFAAVKAAIKPSGNADFACAVADSVASAAAMFTSNRVVAAPVIVGRRQLVSSGGLVRVVAVNAGNANCATGEQGIEACQQVTAAAAVQFGCEQTQVFPSSTGIIGVPLPAAKLVAALPAVQVALGDTAEHFMQFARAIMTTDTKPKTAFASIEVDGTQVRIAGVAKGAGMIHPQLVPHATMLVYLFTDAKITPTDLAKLLPASVESSFNRISIDGDTSTNDTVLLLASGASGAAVGADHAEFRSALDQVCLSLARQIIDDGEGVTHVVELQIHGAASDADALRVARAIAHSPLVKTAWAGCDPNWGRLIAAIGYSGAEIDPARIDIWLGAQQICSAGGRAQDFNQQAAHEVMLQREFTIRIELGVGSGRCNFWTTDLTAEYVRINAEYST